MADKIAENKMRIKQEMELVRKTIDILMETKLQYAKENKSIEQFKEYVETNFQNFCKNYQYVLKMLYETDDISMVHYMINGMIGICDGNVDEKELTKNISEKLAEQYLYPQFGRPTTTELSEPKIKYK